MRTVLIVAHGWTGRVNMKKLIELDASLDALREVIVPAEDIGFGDELTDGYNDGINMAVTVVSGLPTVDAAPVRHGRWKEDPSGYGFWICSACGFVSEASAANMLYKFCPVCGADMRKDDDNGQTD